MGRLPRFNERKRYLLRLHFTGVLLLMVDESVSYAPGYLQGIALFNDCDYFEAHDAWEELWVEHQGPSRKFYQGLIQVAVCLHHFGNGNLRGAKKLYYSSRKYLENYLPEHEGLDVEKFLSELSNCCAEILASEEEFPSMELDPERLPMIQLSPPPE